MNDKPTTAVVDVATGKEDKPKEHKPKESVWVPFETITPSFPGRR